MERLSGMDAFFLYAETPTNHMHVTLCAVIDPDGMEDGYSFATLRSHIQNRLHLVPPLLRRLVPVPLRLSHPLWVEDPDFDLDFHVRRAAVPSPGSEYELADLVAQIASVPLDRTRPLWEMWIVEGLEHGNIALVAKLHHSTLDGIAGVEQMVNFFDLERKPAEVASEQARRAEPDEIPSDLELITTATVERVRGLFGVIPLVQRTAGSILAVRRNRADPDTVSGGTPLACPGTPFNAAITSQRKVAFARVSLVDIKSIKDRAGGTVNDVLLAIVSGALRAYLDKKGALPEDPLVAACPVNVRTEEHAGKSDNRISAMFTSLHTDIDDPVRRLHEISRTSRAAKDEHALFGPDTMQRWAEVADPNLFTWLTDLYSSSGLADRHRAAINVMFSNIPGPDVPLYLAGGTLAHAYPMGQIIDGIGLNVTAMSYKDSVDFGFMAAANLVGDVWDLAAAVAPALAELKDAVEARR
ncbi:MAG: wax ester/triacylglycerol synthase family O-acyltransferase [Actinobacteria bacterium]|nr:wax ester/triacylglycerol synthase family O-acyltransferase [Actinomycetota bacterium]